MYRIRDQNLSTASLSLASQTPQAASAAEIIDLRCQLCHCEMVAPSTRDSRRHVSMVCESHIMHKTCFAQLKQKRCPTCKTSVETNEFSESASLILWRSGVRPLCGCGRTDHTREKAAACPAREVTCLFPGCVDSYYLNEQDIHYSTCHPGEVVVSEPRCPYQGCQDAQQTFESFDAHVAECVYRPVTCVCGEDGPLYLIQQHQATCDKVQCPTRLLVKTRFGITLPGGKCRHGLGITCPFEAFMRAVLDMDCEQATDFLREIVDWRQSYAL
jgi:hypothetical protein